MENWDDLKFVLAMMRHGTMSSAARYLDTNVATVSRRLERLSQSLETPLFEKKGQHFVATQAAERLATLADEMDQRLRGELAAMHEADENVPVRLEIAAPPAVHQHYLLPRMTVLTDHLPQVQFSLVDKVFAQGLGEADIQIRIGRPEGGRLIARKFRDYALAVFHGKDHTLDGQWIGLSHRYPDADFLRRIYPDADPQPRYRVEEMPFAHQLVRMTGLPALLPDFMVDEREDGIVRADLRDNALSDELWIAYHETRHGDSTLRAAVDWICKLSH
ncbi:LysR family transcriptional regulator [Jannaschia aquimarina]|uniref:CynR_2 protein n=1 Tax=Jannaschia aquimarina TaxID=935700 RepID=A0A0D1CMB2_9RHOB|nr:LysR family transcriptional regulator [Jannaschia aquimarina]KIT15897.1 HTH-type transcriptional regulator CynR [Jannaschia aquimarina]SNS97286.1 DNA-binding transcriptional regulator, LysR family [Jannaschia aquimarina]